MNLVGIALALVALVLAVIELVRSEFGSLIAWAVVALSVAVILFHWPF